MHHDENIEDLVIDDEDLLAVAALTEEDIAAIDCAIWQKQESNGEKSRWS